MCNLAELTGQLRTQDDVLAVTGSAINIGVMRYSACRSAAVRFPIDIETCLSAMPPVCAIAATDAPDDVLTETTASYVKRSHAIPFLGSRALAGSTMWAGVMLERRRPDLGRSLTTLLAAFSIPYLSSLLRTAQAERACLMIDDCSAASAVM